VLLAILGFVLFRNFMKFYSKITLKMVHDYDPGFTPRPKWMKTATTISLAWHLLGIIASGIIFLLTITGPLNDLIAVIFRTVGGPVEVIDLLFQEFNEMMTIGCITMAYTIAFSASTGDSLGHAVHVETGGGITKDNGRKLALAGLCIVMCVAIMLIILPCIALGGLLSQLGIETLTGG
jgi:hypothetical protein